MANHFNINSINDTSDRHELSEKQKEDRAAARYIGDKRSRVDNIALERAAALELLEVWELAKTRR